MFGRLFNRRSGRRLVDRLHGDIVTAARREEFYVNCGVRDTFEGRFEILVLHMSAVVRRLEQLPDPGRAMAQELTESMFGHLDIALREIGVSDLGVPKRMKKLAGAYFGRSAAYAAGLAREDDRELADALTRNIYPPGTSPDDPRVRSLAGYCRALQARLACAPPDALLVGAVEFPQAPAGARGQP